MLLGERSGPGDPKTVAPKLLVGPLFGNVEDLQRAPAVMDRLVRRKPFYGNAGQQRRGRQAHAGSELGYSGTEQRFRRFLPATGRFTKPNLPASAFSCQYEWALRISMARLDRWLRGGWGPPIRPSLASPAHHETPHSIHEQGPRCASKYFLARAGALQPRNHDHRCAQNSLGSTSSDDTPSLERA